MGQARKSAHGAGAQVQNLFEEPSNSVCYSVCERLRFGAGAMMVGEELFCSLAHGCKQCPICNSKVGFDVSLKILLLLAQKATKAVRANKL